MNGILILNKPLNCSSNKAVSMVKKALDIKKVGHLGTLDPMASGVLPICINKATKLFDYYLNKDKTYIAEFTFGKTTDTLDCEGEITETCEYLPSQDEVFENIKKLIGEIEQLPPKYSAKSVGGKRAYELVRSGIEFELKPKKVNIYDIKLLSKKSDDTYEFEISCSSGTYIRAIARDLGKLCNTVCYMSKLVRTRCGEFELKNAVNVDDITIEKVIPLEKVLSKLERFDVESSSYEKLKNGVKIVVNENDKDNILIYSNNELFGIGEIKDKILKIKTYLHN